jgi:hypothetical protein
VAVDESNVSENGERAAYPVNIVLRDFERDGGTDDEVIFAR